jgi:azurin
MAVECGMDPRIGILLVVTLALFSAGCGGAKKQPEAPSAEQPGVRTVVITANDAMQFSQKVIAAKPGEVFTLRLENVGRMPKTTMAHNFVLLQPMTDEQVMAFAASAVSRAPEYLPADVSAILAHTRLLGPGEKEELSITAPAQPGAYPYLCTFPGHAALMRGTLRVEP